MYIKPTLEVRETIDKLVPKSYLKESEHQKSRSLNLVDALKEIVTSFAEVKKLLSNNLGIGNEGAINPYDLDNINLMVYGRSHYNNSQKTQDSSLHLSIISPSSNGKPVVDKKIIRDTKGIGDYYICLVASEIYQEATHSLLFLGISASTEDGNLFQYATINKIQIGERLDTLSRLKYFDLTAVERNNPFKNFGSPLTSEQIEAVDSLVSQYYLRINPKRDMWIETNRNIRFNPSSLFSKNK